MTRIGLHVKSYSTAFLAVCLVFVLSGQVFAQDPAEETDPRLEQKITVEAGFIKLADLLADISKQTGIELKAGGSEREWKVAERKVSIEAVDVPAGKVLGALSELLRFRMTRAKRDGKFTYLFWQDKNARDLEADLVLSGKENSARKARETREKSFDTLEDALKLSKDEAMAGRDKNPFTAYIGGTPEGRSFAELMLGMRSMYPDAYELLMRGRKAAMPLTGLPPNLAAAAKTALTGGLAAEQIKKMKPEDLEGITPSQMTITPMTAGGGDTASDMGFGGMIMINAQMPGKAGPFGGGGVPLGVYFLAPGDSLMGRAMGKMLLTIAEGGSMEEAQKTIMSEFTQTDVLAEALGHESPTEKDTPTDPALTREIDLPKGPGFLGDMSAFERRPEIEKEAVHALATAIGMPVIVEAFTGSMPITTLMAPGKQPLYQALIALEKTGLLWEIKGGALRIRPENWALLRSYEIPQSFIDKCIALTEREGGLTLDDLAWIASSLTDEQIQNTLVTEPKLLWAVSSTMMNPMGSTREMLRLYYDLNPAQKAALKTEAGIDFGALSPDQWERMSNLISDNLGGVYVESGSMALTTSTEEEKKKMNGMSLSAFKVKVLVDGSENPVEFQENVMMLGAEQMKQAKAAAEKMMPKKDADKDKEQPKPDPAP